MQEFDRFLLEYIKTVQLYIGSQEIISKNLLSANYAMTDIMRSVINLNNDNDNNNEEETTRQNNETLRQSNEILRQPSFSLNNVRTARNIIEPQTNIQPQTNRRNENNVRPQNNMNTSEITRENDPTIDWFIPNPTTNLERRINTVLNDFVNNIVEEEIIQGARLPSSRNPNPIVRETGNRTIRRPIAVRRPTHFRRNPLNNIVQTRNTENNSNERNSTRTGNNENTTNEETNNNENITNDETNNNENSNFETNNNQNSNSETNNNSNLEANNIRANSLETRNYLPFMTSRVERPRRRYRNRSSALNEPVSITSTTYVVTTPPPLTTLDSPVRIRPNNSQIRNSTEIINYTDLSANDRSQPHCPIDLNPFSDDDTIMKIKYCGHIFRELNLRSHFRYSPRCPICRYDIRDYECENTVTSINPPINQITTRSGGFGAIV
jgi:hypothetical protein